MHKSFVLNEGNLTVITNNISIFDSVTTVKVTQDDIFARTVKLLEYFFMIFRTTYYTVYCVAYSTLYSLPLNMKFIPGCTKREKKKELNNVKLYLITICGQGTVGCIFHLKY